MTKEYTKQTGKVLWFDPVKGYGFIAQDNEEDDIFVHFRYIKIVDNQRVELQKNQLVSYKIEDGKKGLHAVDVEIINQPFSGANTDDMSVQSS